MPDYTPEQIKDIQEREAKGLAFLKELGLTPSAAVQKFKMAGPKNEELFMDQIIPFLQDTKYVSKPVSKEEGIPTNVDDIK